MLWLLLALIFSLVLAWYRAGLRTTTASFAALLLAYGVFGASPLLFGLWLLLFVGVFVPLSLPTLREEWLTRPLLDHVQRRLLPARAGRLAGFVDDGDADRHWLGDRASLFAPAAAAAPSDDAATRLLAALESSLSARSNAQSESRSASQSTPTLPALPALLSTLVSLRACAPSLPASSGGLGLDERARSQLLQCLASMPGGDWLARAIGQYDSAAQVFLTHASAAQRDELLPSLADGSTRLVLAQRARWGSSGTLIPDHAQICRGIWKGRETLGLTLDFDQSVFEGSANADPLDQACSHATDYLLTVRLSDPEHLLGNPAQASTIQGRTDHGSQAQGSQIQQTLALVRVTATQADLEWRSSASGQACARLSATQLFLPLDRLIGDNQAIGLGNAAQKTAIGTLAAAELAILSGRAARRLHSRIIDARVATFYRLTPQTDAQRQRTLTESALDVYALDVLRRLLANALAAPTASPRIAALAIGLGVDLAAAVRQRLGDSGSTVSASGDPSVGSADLPDITWALYPQWHSLLSAASAAPYGVALQRFDTAFWPQLAEIFAHQAQAGLLALSDGALAGSRASGGRSGQHLQRYRAALACCCDALLLSTRAGPAGGSAETALIAAMTQTLALAAALRSHASDGYPRSTQALLDAFCERCCCRIQAALDAFIRAQPTRRRRTGLRAILLPLGRWTRTLSDTRCAQLATQLLTPGPLRERLHWRLSPTISDAVSRLETALDAATPIQQQLLRHLDEGTLQPAFPLAQIADAVRLKLINTEQAEQLRAAYNLSEDWRLRGAGRPAQAGSVPTPAN